MNQEMPNWCTNSLTLTGKKEWIDALMKVSETDDKDIFMHLRPCIEDAEWYSDPTIPSLTVGRRSSTRLC